jgi:hypothetical protein
MIECQYAFNTRIQAMSTEKAFNLFKTEIWPDDTMWYSRTLCAVYKGGTLRAPDVRITALHQFKQAVQ